MCLNHIHDSISVGGNMSRDNGYLVLLKNIANGAEKARLLRRADTDMRFVAADIQNDIGRSPCLKHDSWRVVGGSGEE